MLVVLSPNFASLAVSRTFLVEELSASSLSLLSALWSPSRHSIVMILAKLRYLREVDLG